MRQRRASAEPGAGSTAWKIRIANEDLEHLKCVSQAIAANERGLVPEPSITAMIQKAIKNYISEAFECYGLGMRPADSIRLMTPQGVSRQAS